jgi:hypothetical protein
VKRTAPGSLAILLVTTVCGLAFAGQGDGGAIPLGGAAVAKDCTFKGRKLQGKVKVVQSFPDLKVKVVENFPDLKVKIVENFPDACGKWKLVENFPDFTIQYVENFPDLEIKMVENFPGLP